MLLLDALRCPFAGHDDDAPICCKRHDHSGLKDHVPVRSESYPGTQRSLSQLGEKHVGCASAKKMPSGSST